MIYSTSPHIRIKHDILDFAVALIRLMLGNVGVASVCAELKIDHSLLRVGGGCPEEVEG